MFNTSGTSLLITFGFRSTFKFKSLKFLTFCIATLTKSRIWLGIGEGANVIIKQSSQMIR